MTSIDNMAAEIMKGLTEYADLANESMKKAVKKNCHRGKKRNLRQCTKGHRLLTQKAGPVKKTKENSHSLEMTVHSKNRYQLAHLLEKRPRQAWRRTCGRKSAYIPCRGKRRTAV